MAFLAYATLFEPLYYFHALWLIVVSLILCAYLGIRLLKSKLKKS